MNIVFMGTPDFAVPTLEKLYDNNHNVLAVFSQPDRPKGRGMKLTPPPVKVCATEHNTICYQPESLRKERDEYIQILKDLNPDVIVVVAFGQILTKEVLDIPEYGCINVHGSLLPKYRGAAPIQQSVLDGEKYSGVTTMLMAEGLDTGDMLLKAEVEIGENETSAELYERLSYIGADLLIETLEKLEKNLLTPVKQDESLATYAGKLSKDLCPIDFSKSAQEVHNQIRGLSDWPCATTTINGKRLKVYRSQIVSNDSDKKPGTVVSKDLVVKCGIDAVKLVEIQAEGSKRMNSSDYLRGKPVEIGTVLGE